MSGMIRLAVMVLAVALASVAHAQPVVPKFSLNEGSTTQWPIQFYDDQTPPAPVVPATATYKIETLAGSVLVNTTAISPLASSVMVPVAALTFPPGEQVVGNPRLPPAVPAAFTLTYTWGMGKSRQDFVWFSLVNVP
jgi:hypothetical protein